MVKKIHYIWLGGKRKPRVIQRCIRSWKEHMPDWDIIEWNESNVDLDIDLFCRQAYNAGKYAFASDVLRFHILYQEGGLYFDTDVKLLRSMEPLAREQEAFSGYELSGRVNPGVALYCAEPGNPIVGEMLDRYARQRFLKEDGSYDLKVVGAHFGQVLEKYGFTEGDKLVRCGSFTIYPATYFSPKDDLNRIQNFTENTYSVHLYAASWTSPKRKFTMFFKRAIYALFGAETVQRMKRILRRRK